MACPLLNDLEQEVGFWSGGLRVCWLMACCLTLMDKALFLVVAPSQIITKTLGVGGANAGSTASPTDKAPEVCADIRASFESIIDWRQSDG